MKHLTVERNREGAWNVSALLNDCDGNGAYYHTHSYYGYTKKEAQEMYLREFGKKLQANYESTY